jgi:colanic acid/amylovoran biosynthesis glycosyltransferase
MVLIDNLAVKESVQSHNPPHLKDIPDVQGLKVAYIMSRFPKLTETFILYEMLALEDLGVQVEIYPLMRARKTTTHPEGGSFWKKLFDLVSLSQGKLVMHLEAKPMVERANYQPFLSWPIFQAQLRALIQKPRKYLGTLWTLIRSNWGSWNFLIGGLSIFPKSVYFAELIKNEDIHHVHAHFANHPAAAAYIIHEIADIPFSFTAHGADLQVDQHMLAEKVDEALFVVTISQFNKEFILDKCGEHYREKVIVVHCGVDTNIFLPASGSYESDTDEVLNILCVGTMYEVKGHQYLIEACRFLDERGINFRCHLVGDGPDREELVRQVDEFRLSDKVIFYGQRTRQEIVTMLQGAQIFSLPSVPTNEGRREGIPVVLMEAMACGIPVVASAISGIPELVDNGKNGILVPPRDAHSLANAFERLYLEPGLREDLGDAAREKVLREFNLHKNAATLSQFFNQVRKS